MRRKGMIMVIVYMAAVAYSTVLFNFNFLTSTLLFFIPPSLYVTLRRQSLFAPLIKFSVLVGIPFVLIIDSIALLNNVWWETSILSHRVFGLITYENVLWAISYTYFITSLYEYFLADKEEPIKFSSRFWIFEAILLTALSLFILVFWTDVNLLSIPHFYAVWIALCYGMPTVVGLIRYQRKFIKYWTSCLYFSVMLFVGELAALTTSQWGFQGSGYLGLIHIGSLTFPYEEMIWILFGAPAFIYVYRSLTSQKI